MSGTQGHAAVAAVSVMRGLEPGGGAFDADVATDARRDPDGDDSDDGNQPSYEIEALFEDWIVDNHETPMAVPQTQTEFAIEFTRSAGASVHLVFSQDPALRARDVAAAASPALLESLSSTERVSVTGAVTWNGGVSLGHFVAVTSGWGSHLAAGGHTFVELGAGTGVCGLMAAAAGADVTATDRDEILPVLRRNVDANLEAVAAAGGRVETREYSWGVTSPDGFPGGRTFDVVLAADCVYDMEGIGPLLAALRDLSHAPPAQVADEDGAGLGGSAAAAAAAAAAPGASGVNEDIVEAAVPLLGASAGAPGGGPPPPPGRTRMSSTIALVAFDTAIGRYGAYKVRALTH
jgi:predicted nicotinamide N-methyase